MDAFKTNNSLFLSSLAVRNLTIFLWSRQSSFAPSHTALYLSQVFFYCRHSQKPQCADEFYECAREACHIEKFLHLDTTASIPWRCWLTSGLTLIFCSM